MSEAAGFSQHHFSRVFAAIVGEDASQLVRRLRLERAAADLANTDEQIIRIALRCGYSGHGPFSRAFRAHFGVSPSAYRRNPVSPAVLRPASNGVHLETAFTSRFDALPIGVPMIAEIVVRRLPAVTIHGVPVGGTYADVAREVHRAMAFYDRSQPAGLSDVDAVSEVVGIVPNAAPPEVVGFHVCVVPRRGMPCCFGERSVPIERAGGLYAVAVAPGPYEQLDDAYAWIYRTWDRKNGYGITGGEPFEVYLNDPIGGEADSILTAIHVPVVPLDDVNH